MNRVRGTTRRITVIFYIKPFRFCRFMQPEPRLQGRGDRDHDDSRDEEKHIVGSGKTAVYISPAIEICRKEGSALPAEDRKYLQLQKEPDHPYLTAPFRCSTA